MDALLLVSFGGPEGPDDVMPFLENVTRGRNVPRARLAEVAEHYHHFGGVSPINGHCRALKAELERLVDVPVYWGNRNWAPFLTDTVAEMAADGVTRATAFVTSAYSGYSSSGQYQEDLDRAVAAVPGAPEITKIPPYCLEPGFVGAFTEAAKAALAELPGARLVFTAHSVPLAQPGRPDYEAELHEVARRVHAASGARGGFDLVYQSRSGPPSQPWLEPDVLDHLAKLASDGTDAVALVPIGFVSDHMEVLFDLDVEARDRAADLGVRLVRAATPGTALAPLARDLYARHAKP
ncbi:ferrochelatase [Actinocorallia sp. API 0066]|uniref:ferrochelatase n=1 Tax=Actinocorallia sp. API 0066 TaxID=2896846 RepID=UPI001E644DAE|nr:ferrochelatase [Actinocorallia sp. API 0066]MCD0451962.1 ferrochelatase [Actinocorallia sp. API 0066]